MISILKTLRKIVCGTIRAVAVYMYRLWNYLMTWQMHRDTIKHLNQLSNRELNDIGLTRNDINNLVWMKEDFNRAGDKVKEETND